MSNGTDLFWHLLPMISVPKRVTPLLEEEKLFNAQMQEISDRVLIDTAPQIIIHEKQSGGVTQFKTTPGAVVAGSSLMHLINPAVSSNDVDIYVKSKEDARLILAMNGMKAFPYDSEFCTIGAWHNIKINIIWGIKFETAKDLISGFDMRCCAMAVDIDSGNFYSVDGAVEDAINRRIVFQTNPRLVSVHRLLKYLGKSFTIDKYQRTVFAELIKSGKHDNKLELLTGYGEAK